MIALCRLCIRCISEGGVQRIPGGQAIEGARSATAL